MSGYGGLANPVVLTEITDPAGLTNTGHLYTNDVAGLTELMYKNDAGTEVQITSGSGLLGAPIDAQYLALAANATLTGERVFTPGSGLSAVDSGAGAAYTLSFATTGAGAAFVQGGNSLGALATLGTNDANALALETNNVERARILSTGEALFGATALVSTEIGLFKKDQNAGTSLFASNATVGTASSVSIGAVSNSGSMLIQQTSTGFTPGVTLANESVLLASSASASMLIITNGASAPIRLATNQTERARILQTGEFLIGATALVGGEFTLIRKDQDAPTVLTIQNNNINAASTSGINLTIDANKGLSLQALSSSHIGSSGALAGEMAVRATALATGLVLGCVGADPVRFQVNAVEAARFDTSGNLDLVNTLEIGGVTLFEADRDLAADIIPNTDNSKMMGSETRRMQEVHSQLYETRTASGDANPIFRIASAGALVFGPGGASALDARLRRNGANLLEVDNFAGGNATFNVIGTTRTDALEVQNDNGVDFQNQTDGVGASAGTLTNAPSVGNPSFWIRVKIGGANRFIPAWS